MKNAVILVHGVSISPRCMDPMAQYLRKRGWKVLRPEFLPANGSIPIEVLAEKLSGYIAAHTEPGERIDLVGFSMGGLVCRYYLQCLGGAIRTDRLVTIATPHSGTRIAEWLPGAGMKQMRRNSPFLEELRRTAERLRSVSCMAIYTPWDCIILPASSALMFEAQAIRMHLPGHPAMLYHPAVFKKLAALLAAPRSVSGGR